MYATLDNLRGAIAEDVILYLVDDERQRTLTPAGEQRITQKLLEATSEVNSYLAQRYELPLATIPDILKAKTLDIAVYRLFLRRGIRPGTADELVMEQYKTAIGWLRDVATGKASITTGTGSEDNSTGPAEKGVGSAKVSAKPRVFDRDSLEDF